MKTSASRRHSAVQAPEATALWRLLRAEEGAPIIVIGPDGFHPALSRAVTRVCAGYSSSTIGKMCRWLAAAFGHLAPSGDIWSRLTQRRDALIAWATDFLRSNGCQVTVRNSRDGSFRVTRPGRSSNQVSLALTALRALLDEVGAVRPDKNPFVRADWTSAKYRTFRNGVPKVDAGNQFRVLDREWSPPRLHDSRRLFVDVIAAGEAYGWPKAVLGISRSMGEGGGRFCDTAPLTYFDWAVGSEFGLDIMAPNKGSHGERVKTVSISETTPELIEISTDERHAEDLEAIRAGRRPGPPRPSMREVRALSKTERGREALARLPLFPAAHGGCYTSSGFNDQWFKPAMIAAAVVMHGPHGERRPTPHWLRHFHIEERLRAMPEDLSEAEQEAYEEQILQDMHFATNQLPRYGAHHKHQAKARRQRSFANSIASFRDRPVAPPAPVAVGPGAAAFGRARNR